MQLKIEEREKSEPRNGAILNSRHCERSEAISDITRPTLFEIASLNGAVRRFARNDGYETGTTLDPSPAPIGEIFTQKKGDILFLQYNDLNLTANPEPSSLRAKRGTRKIRAAKWCLSEFSSLRAKRSNPGHHEAAVISDCFGQRRCAPLRSQ